MLPVALTIAGSDPSGGAGIQADLKTFCRFGVYGEAVITLLTVQNTRRVSRVEIMPPDLVLEQLRSVIEDIPPAAAKTGALGNQAMVDMLAEVAGGFQFPLVIDPVMISKHGAPLMDERAQTALQAKLLRHAMLVTPNLPEAAALTGLTVEDVEGMRRAARKLHESAGCHVLVKGGHLRGDSIDVLYSGGEFHEFASPRIETRHTHGTGCTYSAAIAALLAKGLGLVDAVGQAKLFVTAAIRTNPGLGAGNGPVNHFAS